ncbi:MAG: hypothetical protein ACI4R9_06490 [Kiritimatiellia bacterium]
MNDVSRPLALACGCAAFCLAGCFSLDHGRFVRTNEEHVLVSNYGWYLFDYIPLVCGNANKDRRLPWVMFRDDVQMDKIQYRFMDYAGERRARDLAYNTTDSVLLMIPGIGFPLPIPYVLTYREIQLSGVLEPGEGKPEEGAGQ